MDLLKLNGEERIVSFLRRNSLDWDFVKGQLLEQSHDDQLFLRSWCQKIIHWLEGSVLGLDLDLDYEDRLIRLESDKDTLNLQVSLLSQQIHAQTTKIHNLEKLLEDKKGVVETAEEKLQKELVTRSGLETQRLELMTEISGLRLKLATLERENFEIKGRSYVGFGFGSGSGRSLTDLNYGESRYWEKPPVPVGRSGVGVRCHESTSTSPHRDRDRDRRGNQNQNQNQTPPSNSYRHHTSPSSFATLPRRSQPSLKTNLNSTFDTTRGLNQNLGNESENENDNEATPESQSQEISTFKASSKTNENSGTGHKSRRILRILGKLKRSNSGGFDNDIYPSSHTHDKDKDKDNQKGSHFIRGGLRSTAIGVPRLGWTEEQNSAKIPEGPVSSWDCESVLAWLSYLGLNMYASDFKRWVKSGQQLLDATSQELEKDLNIKNYLHRKKLSLALHSLKHPEEEDRAGKLDYQWVTRWLDDVGLPQYKVSFAEARVDGRMLSRMTPEDLLTLKVTSSMHHLSLKRGIQILRIHRFHPSCLCRRGRPRSYLGLRSSNSNDIANIADLDLTEDINGINAKPRSPTYVATWTNHRVMEWLKVVDLAEYAPNLRGSGVHGALLLFEPSFNAELLATLLSIPQNKTLLRRHLSLQFNELVGKFVVQEKRIAEIAADYIPLNPTVKVKVKAKTAKKSPFPLRKKRLSAEFTDELLCPLDWDCFPEAWDTGNNEGVLVPDLQMQSDV